MHWVGFPWDRELSSAFRRRLVGYTALSVVKDDGVNSVPGFIAVAQAIAMGWICEPVAPLILRGRAMNTNSYTRSSARRSR